MPTAFLSSGDPIADRRYQYAVALAEAGDHRAAADLFEQALEIAPGWPAGWVALGRARAAAGDRDGAASAFAQAAALDPDDRLGAALERARLLGEAPPAPPGGYVRALFDAYADRFEAALVGRLGYRAPALLAAALDRAAPGRRFAAALDLGCGTGLMGAAVRARIDRLDGVDLAPAMVAAAAGKGVYDALEVGDAVAALGRRPAGGLDLVLAADMFCYLGDLGPVLAAASRALRPGGLLAFTVERAGDPDCAFALGEALRYAHGAAALARSAERHGFAVAVLDEAELRLDRGVPIAGLIGVFAQQSEG